MPLSSMRLLLISNVFPPDETTRATQVSRLAVGLAETGVEVHVLTRGSQSDQAGTPLHVHRVSLSPAGRPSGSRGKTSHARIAWRRLLERKRWARAVQRFYSQISADLDFDYILSFSHPFENHQATLALYPAAAPARWIAYWSDPWPSTVQVGPYRRFSLLARLVYERDVLDVLRQASVNLFPNRLLREHMAVSFGTDLENRSHIVPHIGTEATGLSIDQESRGRLVHLGSLTRERAHPDLLRAVLRARQRLGPERFKGLRLIGKVCSELRRWTVELDTGDAVLIEPGISPAAAVRVAAASEVLLVIEAPMEKSVYAPSKFADYALSGRPILSISPPIAPLRDVVERVGGVGRVSFCEYDEEQIFETICATFGTRKRQGADAGGDQVADALATYYSQERICMDLKDFLATRQEVP